MTFVEFMDTTNEVISSADNDFKRYSAFVEASYNEYLTNIEEAKLKVIKESGTEDDLIYLENSASEGFIVRAKKTIDKLIEALKKFIKDLVDKTRDFFNTDKTKKTLAKVEKAAKSNPKLKNKKIEIPDTDKGNKFFDKLIGKTDRKIAMMNAGKFSKNDKDELEEIRDEFDKSKAAIIGATILIPIGVAIGVIYSEQKELENVQKNKDKMTINITNFNADTDPADVENIIDTVELDARLTREKSSFIVRNIHKIMSSIAGAITGTGEIEPTLKEESVEIEKREIVKESDNKSMTDGEIDSMLNSILESVNDNSDSDENTNVDTTDSSDGESDGEVTESENGNEFTPEEYLESMEIELFSESTEENSNDDTLTPEEYLECMENELFGEESTDSMVTVEEYLESMEAELFGESEETETEEVTVENSDDDTLTPEEYLECMENELFGDDNSLTLESLESSLSYNEPKKDDDKITLESLENELFK